MKIIAIFIFLLPYISFSQINQTDANGLRQGFWQKQQANGKLLYEGNFKDGIPVGEWKRYHEGGQLKALINYEGDSAKTQLFDQWKNKMAEGGEVSNELKNFNLDDLDIMEDFHYKHFSKNMPKEEALQVIINSVEGDYSQLSDKLRQIAEKQQPIAG